MTYRSPDLGPTVAIPQPYKVHGQYGGIHGSLGDQYPGGAEPDSTTRVGTGGIQSGMERMLGQPLKPQA